MKFFLALAGSLAASVGLAAAQVERATFDSSPFSLGSMTERDGALARDLWVGSKADDVREQLLSVPTQYDDPAKRLILRRVLLSPGEGPEGADGALAGLKLLKAAQAGYVMEAGGVAELMPGLALQPELSQIVAMRDLYRGDVEQACGRGANLREGRQTTFFVRLRVLCYLHADERPAAELTLNLAREEGVLEEGDAEFFRALLGSRSTDRLPTNAVQYAAYRKLGKAFAGEAAEALPAELIAPIAWDERLGEALRAEALERAVAEDLLSARDLEEIARGLTNQLIGKEMAAIRSLPPSSADRGAVIGQALQAVRDQPNQFLMRAKIFAADIASTGVDVATVPYAAEFALASLLNRRYNDAESWMQTVAAEQSLGAERAFLNLAMLYAYVEPTAAQRLAGAIGEEIGPVDIPPLDIADKTAQVSTIVDLSSQMGQALDAAASGSRAALLLAALSTAAVEADTPQIALLRDALGADLYERAEAESFAREATFRREALAAASKLRDNVIGQSAYIPRLKPSRDAR